MTTANTILAIYQCNYNEVYDNYNTDNAAQNDCVDGKYYNTISGKIDYRDVLIEGYLLVYSLS